jgi:hypothetical protein
VRLPGRILGSCRSSLIETKRTCRIVMWVRLRKR